jgi:hypothetical protein
MRAGAAVGVGDSAAAAGALRISACVGAVVAVKAIASASEAKRAECQIVSRENVVPAIVSPF